MEATHIGIFLLLLIGAMIAFHFLLFREYHKQFRSQQERMSALEEKIRTELDKSSLRAHADQVLKEIKEKSNDQLEVIKLQIEALKLKEQGKN